MEEEKERFTLIVHPDPDMEESVELLRRRMFSNEQYSEILWCLLTLGLEFESAETAKQTPATFGSG